MRIVRIIARLNVGGPARHVAWLTAALSRAGHESVLVSGVVAAGEDDMSYFAAGLGVEPLIIPEMSREISPKDALTIWKLYRLLVRLKPDIVHTHTAKAGTAGRIAGMLYRWLTPSALLGRPRPCRFVHTYHGHVFHSYYGALKTRIFLGIERALARLSTDRIVVISPQQLREIHDEFRVGRREQFAVIPLGLETEVFDGWENRRRAARARFGAGETDDVLLVGIVGRLTEVKNHRLFLEAAARTKRTRDEERHDEEEHRQKNEKPSSAGVDDGDGRAPRVRFVVIGDGHLRRELEEYARTLGLDEEDVTFTGTLRDPENFYAALDVVALTSLNEGTPLTLIEAMASARAVAATAVGGVTDLLGEEFGAGSLPEREGGYRICERGVRVASGDAAGMASALLRLASDAELRRWLGARGRAYVEREFSVRRLVADVTKLYEELAESPLGKEKGKGRGWAKEDAERRSAF